MTEPAWTYDPSLNPDDYEGFTYEITNLESGRKYIGRKYLQSRRGGKTKESDWRTYWGSCKELTADLQRLGHERFTRTILAFHSTRLLTNYHEAKLQFECNVLIAVLPDGSPAYYNSNILGKYYRKAINATPKQRQVKTKKCRKGHVLEGNETQCRACVALKSGKNRYQYK